MTWYLDTRCDLAVAPRWSPGSVVPALIARDPGAGRRRRGRRRPTRGRTGRPAEAGRGRGRLRTAGRGAQGALRRRSRRCPGCGWKCAARRRAVVAGAPRRPGRLGRRRCCSCSTWCPVGVALAVVDWRTRLLPTRLIAPSYVVVGGARRAGLRSSTADWPTLVARRARAGSSPAAVLRAVVRLPARHGRTATSGCPGLLGIALGLPRLGRAAGRASTPGSCSAASAASCCSLLRIVRPQGLPVRPVHARRRLARRRAPGEPLTPTPG